MGRKKSNNFVNIMTTRLVSETRIRAVGVFLPSFAVNIFAYIYINSSFLFLLSNMRCIHRDNLILKIPDIRKRVMSVGTTWAIKVT